MTTESTKPVKHVITLVRGALTAQLASLATLSIIECLTLSRYSVTVSQDIMRMQPPKHAYNVIFPA